MAQKAKGKKMLNVKKLFRGGQTIRGKLLFWLLIISLVPMAVIGFVSYEYSSSSLQRQSFEQLETTLAFQYQALHRYFNEQARKLENISGNMRAFQEEAYTKLSAVRALQKKQVKSYFKMRFEDVQMFGESPQQQQAFSQLLSNTTVEPSAEFVEFLEDWLANRDFYSLTLLSQDGKVVFSTDREVERGAPVQEGTSEWEAVEKGMQETRFIDYHLSSFWELKHVAYFSTPLFTADQAPGLLLFRLQDNALDSIMKDTTGLGETGESYMVGMDGMFRSNSRHFEEPTIANPSFLVDTESIVYALAGEDGETTVVNYRGDNVLSAYTAVSLYGATWVLMVEIDRAEAVVPKVDGEEMDLLAQLAKIYNFSDLYLVSTDGYIFASAGQKKDYLTNILTGPYADSMFSKAVKNVLETREMAVSDYAFYEPAGGQAEAFMAVPIMNREAISMIVVLQISDDPINEIMKIRQQFEKKSGHTELKGHSEMVNIATYLIGPDKLWRSEAQDAKKYKVKSTLLNPKAKVNTEAVQQALKGKSDTKITVNSLGEKVLASWAPVRYKGLNWAIISEVAQEEVDRPVMQLLLIVGLLALFAAAAVIFVSLRVAGGVTEQVDEIMQGIAKVEKGEYGEQVKVTSGDELGRMATSFNQMTTTIHDLIESRQKEHDELQDSIIRLLEEITELADGDLSIRATVTEDVIGTLADSLNLMLEELGTAFVRIKQSAEQVGSTANILSASTGELAGQNNNQSSMINEAVQEINLLTNAIREAANQANQSASFSRESSQVAAEGAKAVRETSQAMEVIRGNVQNTARSIKRLGESSQEISDFARTINEISDRTSILALNASIQAAAAGEEGRGFAVVAEEIQRLAERAAVSTRQIETLIKNILGEITEAGVSMDASIQEVVQGTKLSHNALARLDEITDRSNEVFELIQGVASAAQQQADTTAILATSMGEIGSISLETAEEALGASVSMQEMAVMGDDMLQAVATFKLEAEDQADDAAVEVLDADALDA
ncbi:MAG: methyl-accepting chemotaxis protein [Candidatus Electrothrix sp. GW3-4]|uniref:methyl-accepting chemotaxis protein n=1 Tax=Candidatus Electrothrix sp. GW3-4 TaxID=3126740 RepID=UPI0030D1E908